MIFTWSPSICQESIFLVIVLWIIFFYLGKLLFDFYFNYNDNNQECIIAG